MVLFIRIRAEWLTIKPHRLFPSGAVMSNCQLFKLCFNKFQLFFFMTLIKKKVMSGKWRTIILSSYVLNGNQNHFASQNKLYSCYD